MVDEQEASDAKRHSKLPIATLTTISRASNCGRHRHWYLECPKPARAKSLETPAFLVFVPSSTSNLDDPCDSGGWHGSSGPNPSYGTSSGWWVTLPWRLGPVNPWHTGCQEEFKQSDTAAGACLVSFSGGRPTICDPPARAGSSEDHDRKHINTLEYVSLSVVFLCPTAAPGSIREQVHTCSGEMRSLPWNRGASRAWRQFPSTRLTLQTGIDGKSTPTAQVLLPLFIGRVPQIAETAWIDEDVPRIFFVGTLDVLVIVLDVSSSLAVETKSAPNDFLERSPGGYRHVFVTGPGQLLD